MWGAGWLERHTALHSLYLGQIPEKIAYRSIHAGTCMHVSYYMYAYLNNKHGTIIMDGPTYSMVLPFPHAASLNVSGLKRMLRHWYEMIH